MAKPRRMFIDGEYGQIHVRISTPNSDTENPPLYCLHMSPKSSQQFINFMACASKDRIVVAPDYPGYGESDPPPETPHVSITDYARNMWQVADSLKHEKIDLLGHHTGSKVAAEMAHQQPTRINAIAMVSAAILTAEERSQFNSLYEPIPLDEDGSRFRIMWERIVEHRGPGMTLEMMANALAENMRGGENYEWGHRAAFTYGDVFNTVIGALPHPITILNPADDLQDYSRRAGSFLQNGKVVELPEWGHGLFDVYTEDITEIVRQALK